VISAYVGGCSTTKATVVPDSGAGAPGNPDTGPPIDSSFIEGGGNDAGANCIVQVSSSDPKCIACAQANCCTQIETCFSTPGCHAFETCFTGCLAGTEAGTEAGIADAGSTFDGEGCIQDCANASLLPNCVKTNCTTVCNP
jgi:hypothetical protein